MPLIVFSALLQIIFIVLHSKINCEAEQRREFSKPIHTQLKDVMMMPGLSFTMMALCHILCFQGFKFK